MTTTRARQLEKLAAKLPGANQQVQQGLQEARQTQLQETIRKAGPAAGTRAAQQIGAQQAQAAGAINLQGQQQLAQQGTQLGQLGLQQTARQERSLAAGQQLALNARQAELSKQLNKIDANLKDDLLDKQLTFQKDQAGRTLFNERQLMDWAVNKAQSREELEDYIATAERAHNRKLALYKRSHELLTQKLREATAVEKHERNQLVVKELTKELNALEAAYKTEIANKRNSEARNSGMKRIFGTIVGGTTGFIASGGNPMAAAGGAKIGADVFDAIF